MNLGTQLAHAAPCADEWYYAKGPTQVYGPYKGCQAIPDAIDGDSKLWCGTQIAYVAGKNYGTDWTYCANGGASKCIKSPWLFGNVNGFAPGPHTGCANPDNDAKGSWCPTKAAYIADNKYGTKWEYCSPPVQAILLPVNSWANQYKFTPYKFTPPIPTTPTPDQQFQLMQDQLHYDMAKTGGCWKSDNETWLDPSKGQLPNDTSLLTKGKLLWTDPPGKASIVQTGEDFCKLDLNTGKILLHEYYCATLPEKCTSKSSCIATPKEFTTNCKTGTECKDGACVPIPASSGATIWDGCFVGQAPFLDTNNNGVPDACACPDDMFPTDKNKDGNSDSCGPRDELCSLSDAQKTKLGVTVKAKGLDDGGWTLSDYCSTPFEVTSQVCSDLSKSKGVKSTSKKPCNSGQICQKGSCFDTNSDLCDATHSNKDPKIKGWVTVNASSQLWDKCGAGSSADVVQNVICSSPVDSAVQYYPTPCAATDYCDDGMCKPKGSPGSSGGNSGGGEKKTYDPTKPPTGKGGDNPPPEPGDKSKTPDNKPCTIEMQCKEPLDSAHPVVNGIMLMGDPYIYGVAKAELTCGGQTLPDLDKDDIFKDVCIWTETELLPVLTQYGCMAVKAPPTPSIAPCDWAKNEACDWQAKKGSPQFGICLKNVQKPKVSLKAATATTAGEVSGTNSFGYKVDHKDVCVPAQGKKAIKKWKVVDSPEGAQAYFETCPEQHHCEAGVCVQDPCLANKAKIDDKDPCTDDSCKEDSGDIFNIPTAVDDNDNCTVDKCVNTNGTAKIVHEAIDSPSCKLTKLCTEKPTDPQCVKPVLDCSKTPDNPLCKQLPPALDCSKTPNDPQCKVPLDCTKTPDNPACPKPAKGGFSCDDPANKNDPQCKTSQDYCYDDDTGNDIALFGSAVVFPGTPQQMSATDTCVEFNGSSYTAVLQVACGPNTTFFFKKASCPTQTSKGCVNGVCVPK